MPFIDLGHGHRTLVDDAIYTIVGELPWRAARNGRSRHVYALCSLPDPITGNRLRLHHVVARLAGVPGRGTVVDHIDGDTLNNTAGNLRYCTARQNASSRRRPPGRSYLTPYIGVSLDAQGRAIAQITYRGRGYRIGTFLSPEDAAIARDRTARQLFGEFAILNFAVDPGGPLLSRVDPNRSRGPRRQHPYDVDAVMRGTRSDRRSP